MKGLVLGGLGLFIFALMLLSAMGPVASTAGTGIADSVENIANGDWSIGNGAQAEVTLPYYQQWGYNTEEEALASLANIDAFALEEPMFMDATDTLNLPFGWDYGNLRVPPQDAINDLARAGHHAYARHAIASCILHVTQMSQDPVRVYFSAGAPEKREDYPSVAFMWHLDKILRDLAATPGACAGMPAILQQEYGRVPKFTDVKLFMPVKLDVASGKWITINAYPVLQDVLNSHLCEHHYYHQLYPTLKQVKCAGY